MHFRPARILAALALVAAALSSACSDTGNPVAPAAPARSVAPSDSTITKPSAPAPGSTSTPESTECGDAGVCRGIFGTGTGG